MRLGIKYQHFQYNYLCVLLLRSRPALRDACIACSQQALFLLEDLVSDSSEVFNGVIWIILYCPWTPFFILFGEILSKGSTPSSRLSLKALETMSSFLLQMDSRHPQAAKLRAIAVTFVQYAQQAIAKPSNETGKQTTAAQVSDDTTARDLSTAAPSGARYPSTVCTTRESAPTAPLSQPLLDLFNDPSVQDLSMDMDFWLPNTDMSSSDVHQSNNAEGTWQGNMANDALGFFADSNFDWLAWDSMTDMPTQ